MSDMCKNYVVLFSSKSASIRGSSFYFLPHFYRGVVIYPPGVYISPQYCERCAKVPA